MPTTPYAKLLCSVNFGATTSGGITCDPADTLTFTIEDTTGVVSQLFEIYDYPPDFACPAGWSTDAQDVYYYNTDTTPPSITAPAYATWGKLMCRLTVNEGIKNGLSSADCVDEETAISVESLSGLVDTAEGEENQFGTSWAEEEKKNWRTIEGMAGLAGSAMSLLGDVQLLVKGDSPSSLYTVIDETVTPNRYSYIGNAGLLGGVFGYAAGVARPEVTRVSGTREITLDGVDEYATSNLAAVDWSELHQYGTFILVTEPIAGNGVIFDTMGLNANTRTGVLFFQEASQNLTVLIGNGSGTAYYGNRTTVAAEMAYGHPHVIALRFKAGETDEFDLRIDGVNVHSAALDVTGPDTGAPDRTASIGRYSGLGTYYNGRIWMIAYSSNYATLGQLQDIEARLTMELGL